MFYRESQCLFHCCIFRKSLIRQACCHSPMSTWIFPFTWEPLGDASQIRRWDGNQEGRLLTRSQVLGSRRDCRTACGHGAAPLLHVCYCPYGHASSNSGDLVFLPHPTLDAIIFPPFICLFWYCQLHLLYENLTILSLLYLIFKSRECFFFLDFHQRLYFTIPFLIYSWTFKSCHNSGRI